MRVRSFFGRWTNCKTKLCWGAEIFSRILCRIFLETNKNVFIFFFFLFSCVVSFHHVSASSEMMPVILGRIVVFWMEGHGISRRPMHHGRGCRCSAVHHVAHSASVRTVSSARTSRVQCHCNCIRTRRKKKNISKKMNQQEAIFHSLRPKNHQTLTAIHRRCSKFESAAATRRPFSRCAKPKGKGSLYISTSATA